MKVSLCYLKTGSVLVIAECPHVIYVGERSLGARQYPLNMLRER